MPSADSFIVGRRLTAAEPLCRRLLPAFERVFGPEHPETLTNANNLASCLEAKGDLAAAERDVRDLRTRVGVLEIDVVGLKVAVAGFGDRLSDLQRTTLAGFNDIGESNRRMERLLTDLASRPAS